MAETNPPIIDAWSPEMVAALGWRGEILTDETARVEHRLLAANALISLFGELSPRQTSVYATLPTAIAAMTGRLPRNLHMFDTPDRAIFSAYHNPEKQGERWDEALRVAFNLAHATGEPFYDTGTYRDVGLVLPVRGSLPNTVHTELHWRTNVNDRMLDRVTAQLIFMGMKRRYSVPQNEFVADIQNYKRILGTRSGTTFDIPTNIGYLSYVFGKPAVYGVLDDCAERQNNALVARQISRELNETYPSHMKDDVVDFGTTEERDNHIEMLKGIYRKRFLMGVTLGRHLE